MPVGADRPGAGRGPDHGPNRGPDRGPDRGSGATAIVDRHQERQQLRTAYEEAAAGRGGLVLLAGEAGIGKTTLAEDLVSFASRREASVLIGRCHEGEGAPAYWPWLQILRAHVKAASGAVVDDLRAPEVVALAQLVPEVAELIPDASAGPALGPAQARFRLFEAVASLLRRAAERHPLVIVLDDIHWADETSLLLLEFLVPDLAVSPMLVAATYREGAERSPLLARTLGSVVRGRATRMLRLTGFGRDDVAEYLAVSTGAPSPDELVTAVHRQTEGNPFFLEEVVRLLGSEQPRPRPDHSGRLVIPDTVRAAIARRLDLLTPTCRDLLRVTAVGGREVRHDVLARAARLSDTTLLDALDEAVSASVLNEVRGPPLGWRFSHTLVRETLYEELGSAVRVQVHRDFGQVYEHLDHGQPGTYVDELAYHWFEAASGGSAEVAVGYCTAAGGRALAVFAHEDAAEHYRRALAALDLVDDETAVHRAELLLALATAHRRAGDSIEARDGFRRAAEQARLAGSGTLLARAAVGLAEMTDELSAGTVDERVVAVLEEALAALDPGDSRLRVALLARLANALYWSEDEARRRALAEEAVAVAHRSGDRAALADAVTSRLRALWGPDNIEDRLADATRVLQLADEARRDQGGLGELSPDELALQARRWRVMGLLELGDVAAAEDEIARHQAHAEGLRHAISLGYASMFRALLAMLRGRFDEAESQARASLPTRSVPSRLARGFYAQHMKMMWRSLGLIDGLQAMVDRHVGEILLPCVQADLARLHCDVGNTEAARVLLEKMGTNGFVDIPRDLQWLVTLGHLSHVCHRLGDTARAALLYRLLSPHAGRGLVVGPPPAVCLGPVSQHLGLLALTMGDPAQAAAHFNDAVGFAVRAGAGPMAAEARLGLAEAHLAARDIVAAYRETTAALTAAVALDVAPLVARALALRRRLRARLHADLPAELPADLTLELAGSDSTIEAVRAAVQAQRPDIAGHAADDGLLTILFGEIDGYGEVADELSDVAALRLLRSHHELVRHEVTNHHGQVVKAMGDGFMAVFASPIEALRGALALHQTLQERNRQHAGVPIRVRMGLHTGEVRRERRDDDGARQATVAARVAELATGYDIVVSAELRQLVDGDFDGGTEVHLDGPTAPARRVYRLAVGTTETDPESVRAVLGLDLGRDPGRLSRPSRSARVMATILFTDIVGSTERLAAVGDQRWSELLAAHAEVVDGEVAQFRGRRIKWTGDGALAIFDGAARAVHCANAIRDRTSQLGLEVRAGLHAGEVEIAPDDVHGIAVHIAARVVDRALPGQVLVSGTVKELAAGSGLLFAAGGTHPLKGIADPVPLFVVEDERS